MEEKITTISNNRVKMSVAPDAKGFFKIDITSEFDSVELSAKNFDKALTQATEILTAHGFKILGVTPQEEKGKPPVKTEKKPVAPPVKEKPAPPVSDFKKEIIKKDSIDEFPGVNPSKPWPRPTASDPVAQDLDIF